MRYSISRADFDEAFNFALKYHLSEKKSSSSRTSGATRGLGEVIDSFLRGKLVELGVKNILISRNPQKDYSLDFDIKLNNEILTEPDIIAVTSNGNTRKPECFVEIKNVSEADRWMGLTLEQFETIKKSSELKKTFIIGAYINNRQKDINFKRKDLLGIYVKDLIKTNALDQFPLSFKEFTDISDVEVVIEYVISADDLEHHGLLFKKGGFLYETEIFKEVGEQTHRNMMNGKIKKIQRYSDSTLVLFQIDEKTPIPEFFNEFKFTGTMEVFEKINQKSIKRYVRCLTDVTVSNKILGKFFLEKDKEYEFILGTVGRNPILNRNNIWIAKRNIPFLQQSGLIQSTEMNLEKIAEII